MNSRKVGVSGWDWRRFLRCVAIGLGTVGWLGILSGCGVKHTVSVPVPKQILNAKVATREELLSLLDGYSKVASLSSTTMKITATLGSVETGKLQEYHSAPGYILLQRPDRIRLDVQNPVTRNTLLDVSSIGDDFGLWDVRDRKFFIGKNSADELEIEGETQNISLAFRPVHIYEAILPQAVPVDQPDVRISLKEAQDAQAKYYVISVFKEMPSPWIQTIREIWIERSNLVLARQIVYEGDGRVVSRVFYQRMTLQYGAPLPLSMRIERPTDGYTIDLEFKNWRVDPSLPADAFVLTPPPGARVITLKEKQRSGAF
jgi:outer membrane lipoprotein-sorting protein